MIGQYLIEEANLRIKYILIAPKEKTFKDRADVLRECSETHMDNKAALEYLGFINDNLDVYVLATDGARVTEWLLYDFLAKKSSNAS